MYKYADQNCYTIVDHHISGSGETNFTTTVSGAAAAFSTYYDAIITDGRIGVVASVSGTTSTGMAIARTHVANLTVKDGFRLRSHGVFCNPVLSTAAQEFFCFQGFWNTDTTGAEATDGAYFKYERAVDGDFWVCVTANNSVRTKTVTSVVPSSTFRMFALEMQNSKVIFWIDDVKVAEHTTDIPSGRTFGWAFGGYKTVGITTTQMIAVDLSIIDLYSPVKTFSN